MSQNKLNNLVFLVSKPTFLSKKHDNRHFIGLSLSKTSSLNGKRANSRNRNKKSEETGNRPAPHFLIQIPNL